MALDQTVSLDSLNNNHGRMGYRQTFLLQAEAKDSREIPACNTLDRGGFHDFLSIESMKAKKKKKSRLLTSSKKPV